MRLGLSLGESTTLAAIGATSIFILLNMSRILGFAKTKYYHGRNSIKLQTRDGQSSTFADLVKSTLPTCRLNPFLFNGHLQTIWTALKSETAPIYYKRRVFEQEDPIYPGQFTVDFTVQPYAGKDESLPPRTTYWSEDEWNEIGSDDDRPMLVCLHGLSGGSYELYLRHVLAPLVAPSGGWEACVVNSRGCAMSKITTPVLYNARSTWDVRQAVKWLQRTFPNRPLYGVGFSMGANMLTNYIGEEGEKCIFKAAVVLSCPWELNVSSITLKRSLMGLHVYSRVMGSNLKRLFHQHRETILQNPNICEEDVRKVKYLHQFDRVVQCACWGYPTETAYYRDASSTDSVIAIRIPFLAISATDDPIVGADAIPWQEFMTSPYAVLCTTSLGGHLSWFELGGGRWMARATTAFFQKMHREVESEHYSKSHPLPEGEIRSDQRAPLRPWFDPMRRKLHLEA